MSAKNTQRIAAPVPPELVVRTQGSEHSLQAGSLCRLGRDPDSDVVVTDSRVSWRHAAVRLDRGAWVVEDAGSTNGTYVGSRRVDRIEISTDCVLRLGHPQEGPLVFCSVVPPAAQTPAAGTVDMGPSVDLQPTAQHPLPVRVLRIGRAPDNDLVLADLSVSRYHAELRNSGAGRYEIADLGSANGTFVNGARVSAVTLTERDVVGIGHATLRLSGQELHEFIDAGDVSLTAQSLTVRTSGGKVLLDQVSFPIAERCLLAIIGPSGAGKSTLLGAMTGARPADEGTVLYDNRDLYAHYAELRHRIGLVPQENILHTQLSARRALRYAAELRFPGDTSASERNRRVDEVIEELGLTAHAQTRIDALSGGQRKRVSVALELLTKPSLLFLDEPTSGLDPGLDKSLMKSMAELAHDGRTVIVVTHSVANLDVCDRLLVLVPGGRIAFYGPPAEGLSHFGQSDWADVFTEFERQPDRDWAGEFSRSPMYAQYVKAGLAGGVAAPVSRQPAPPAAPRGLLGQLSTLCRRYLAVIASDRAYLAVLAVLPFVLGVAIRLIPSPEGLAGRTGTNPDAQTLLLMLILGACLAGTANSVRELVKERAIYHRERAAGLSSGAYLLSKLVILGIISGVQAVILVALGLLGRPLPAHGALLASPLAELMLAMAVLAVASMTLGLLVSAVVSTSERTMPFLVLLTMAQVILCGAVLPLNGKLGLDQLSWLAPSRWGFGATASTVDLVRITPPGGSVIKPDPLWRHLPHVWLLDMGLQAALAVAFAFIAWHRLARRSPGRSRPARGRIRARAGRADRAAADLGQASGVKEVTNDPLYLERMRRIDLPAGSRSTGQREGEERQPVPGRRAG